MRHLAQLDALLAMNVSEYTSPVFFRMVT